MQVVQGSTPSTGKRTMVSLGIVGLATFGLLYSTQPLLPVFSREFAVSPAQASLSVSVSTLVLAVSMLFAPNAASRFGTKRVMVCSLAAAALCSLGTAWCHSFGLLLVLRGILGLLLTGLPSLAMAVVKMTFTSRLLGLATGVYIAGTTLGGMSGRIAIGNLSDEFSWRMAMSIVSIAGLICSLLLLWGLPASRQRSAAAASVAFQAMWGKLRDRRLFPIYLLAFLLMGAFVTAYNYISYELLSPRYHLTQSEVGWIYTVYLTGTAASMWMGRLSDRHGRGQIAATSTLLMLCGAGTMLAGPLWLKIGGLALFTFGFFGSHSVASGWVTARVRTGAAQASSLYLLFYYLGSGLLGTVGGYVWGFGEWPAVILYLAMLAAAALVITCLLIRFDQPA